MIDVVGISYRFINDLLRAFWCPTRSISAPNEPDPISQTHNSSTRLDDLAARALTMVFGMDDEGRIKMEKVRHIVEKLGLIDRDVDGDGYELVGSSAVEEELRVEELLVGSSDENGLRHAELLRRAFTVFDEDGDGFIEALEVKRVLECLGLGDGWNMGEFEKMVEVVDLNFDGKVDFSEFELMMGDKI